MAVAVLNPTCLSFCGGVAARTTVAKSKANAIRDRLLYKLRFHTLPAFADAARYHVLYERDQGPDGRPPWASREETQATAVKKLPPAPCFAPVKLGDEEAQLQGTANETGSRCAPRIIRFDPLVVVVPIPSHRSYSSRAKARIYTPTEELAAAVVRNKREFVYEGRDWRSAVEEDEMYVCAMSGEYVHPAHVRYERRANPYMAAHLLLFALFYVALLEG